MFKKWKWLDKPITWRTSLKVSGWFMLIYAIVIGVVYIVTFWDRVCARLGRLPNTIKNKLKSRKYEAEEMEDWDL